MYFSEIVGQKDLKLKIKKSIIKCQSPHCQIVIDPHGYGGLPIALYYSCLPALVAGISGAER